MSQHTTGVEATLEILAIGGKLLTASGKPLVDELDWRLNREITGKERDEWYKIARLQLLQRGTSNERR